MRTTRLVGVMLVAAALLAGGCSGGDGESGPEVLVPDLPPAPTDGIRLVSPSYTLGAGVERFTCMRIAYDVTEDTYVSASEVYQMKGGHHVMLVYVPPGAPLEDAPHECDDSDMGNIRLVGVGTADGVGVSLPEGVAMKIPAGSRLFTQSHYLNTGETEITAQDVIDLHLVPADQVQNIAGSFTEVDLTLDLPPHQDTTRVIDCPIPADMTVTSLVPHMHEFGLHTSVELTRADQSTRMLYDGDWSEALRDNFPYIQFQPHLQLSTTDRIRTTCTWRNDSDEDLLFPREMCATFMMYYPSPDGAMLACDESGDIFKP